MGLDEASAPSEPVGWVAMEMEMGMGMETGTGMEMDMGMVVSMGQRRGSHLW